MDAVDDLAAAVGVVEACRVLRAPRSSHDRARQRPETAPLAPPERTVPARSLAAEQRAAVPDVLNSPRFQDCARREVYATLLDQPL
jgi:putative transposase